MKRLTVLLAIMAFSNMIAFAQKKYEMVIEKTDGSNVVIPTEDIVRTYFRESSGNNNSGGIGDTSQAYLSCPDKNHPHMIDLGLPSGTKWACCNVGAVDPTYLGDYFAWGETETKDVFNERTYQYCYGEDTDGDGYYDKNIQWKNFGNICGTENDVAHVKWGGYWMMPSHEQIVELVNNCTYSFTTIGSGKCGRFVGPNGGFINVPPAGNRYNKKYSNDESCSIWSGTQDTFTIEYARILITNYHEANYNASGKRTLGYQVRPVWNP